MASTLSDRYKARIAALGSTSTTRYKATLHAGAARPTKTTTVYAATGLGELSTTASSTYVTGGAGLTGGIQINATLTGDNLIFADKTLTSATGETIGAVGGNVATTGGSVAATGVDTIAIWDTTDSNGLHSIVDLQQYAISSTTASGSPTVTGVTGASTQLNVGMPVTGTGIASSTTIAAISGTTVTLSQNATASGTVTLTYGIGPQTASNGGTFIINFNDAGTVTASVA